MTDWAELLKTKRNFSTVSGFAKGSISGRAFYSAFEGTPSGGVVRNLLKTHGVDRARALASKALYRRTLT